MKRNVEKWADLWGVWRSDSKRKRVYTGHVEGPRELHFKSLGVEPTRIGMSRGLGRLVNGSVRVKIKLQEVPTTAGIFFGYSGEDRPYYIAQIGAYGSAYCISKYIPNYGYYPLYQMGSVENLALNESYELAIHVAGQRVSVEVGGIHIFTRVLPEPLSGDGYGLFAFESNPVEFTDVECDGTGYTVFVMTPFIEPFDTLYKDVLAPICEELAIASLRIDEQFGPGIILEEIQSQIASADAVIADISTGNPNVFYELGYAHALSKPSLLLYRRADSMAIPFDVRHYRAIFYDDTIAGKAELERAIREALIAIRR